MKWSEQGEKRRKGHFSFFTEPFVSCEKDALQHVLEDEEVAHPLADDAVDLHVGWQSDVLDTPFQQLDLKDQTVISLANK